MSCFFSDSFEIPFSKKSIADFGCSIEGLDVITDEFILFLKRKTEFDSYNVTMVSVAQLVEHWVVAPVGEGSSPFTHLFLLFSVTFLLVRYYLI